MPECHVLYLMDLMIAFNHFLLNFVALLAYFWVFEPFFYIKQCVVLRKSAYPFGQVKTKMYLTESPFFKNSLAGTSGLVLMLNPAVPLYPTENHQKMGTPVTSKHEGKNQ